MTEDLINIDLEDGTELSYDSYEKMVCGLAVQRINYTYSNCVKEMSNFITNQFMDNIDGVLKIHIHNFDTQLLDLKNCKMVLKIKEFLKRDDGNRLYLLLQEAQVNLDKQHYILALKDYIQKNKIKIKLRGDDKKEDAEYIVMDTAYRFLNRDIMHRDKCYHVSCNFNHKEHSSILHKHFDNNFNNHSTNITINFD